MFDIAKIIDKAISSFFAGFFNQLLTEFSDILANVMSTSKDVLAIPLVTSGVKYAQALAFTVLVIKAMYEALQTYILHQNGDPDSDPTGLLIRTGQAVAVIATLPWLVRQMFLFGSKIATDAAQLDTQGTGLNDWKASVAVLVTSSGIVIVIMLIIILICILIVVIQSAIRGAELALMMVIGPIMALSLTANNRAMWSGWFKQLIIICVSQAIQLFMLKGAFGLMVNQGITGGGFLVMFGWLWVTIKSPKFIQQIAYTTGFTGAVGGTAKQAGSMALMRKMMVK